MVAKKFVPSLESLSSLGFEVEEGNLGCPGKFAGMFRTFGGVQKVCVQKKSSCAFFVSYSNSSDFWIGEFAKFTDKGLCMCTESSELLAMMSPVGMTDCKMKRLFGGVDTFFRADFKFWEIFGKFCTGSVQTGSE